MDDISQNTIFRVLFLDPAPQESFNGLKDFVRILRARGEEIKIK